MSVQTTMNIVELLTESFHQILRSKRNTSPYYEAFASREMSYYGMSNGPYVTSASYKTSSEPDLHVGAFNVRVFGQKKVANDDVLNILVQVYRSLIQ